MVDARFLPVEAFRLCLQRLSTCVDSRPVWAECPVVSGVLPAPAVVPRVLRLASARGPTSFLMGRCRPLGLLLIVVRGIVRVLLASVVYVDFWVAPDVLGRLEAVGTHARLVRQWSVAIGWHHLLMVRVVLPLVVRLARQRLGACVLRVCMRCILSRYSSHSVIQSQSPPLPAGVPVVRPILFRMGKA